MPNAAYDRTSRSTADGGAHEISCCHSQEMSLRSRECLATFQALERLLSGMAPEMSRQVVDATIRLLANITDERIRAVSRC